ncbi:unnamed protein product [Rhizophagus irregularis]|uniref:Uncharacterized protein n=1 Tax=Rhizophagus irregularis TaxID=588596 RepID=A0A2I1E5W0_9GLOM|nr:hypothetical protein RhiirB3_382596 [Rhizophagus irregularis]CAB5383322.1 unnamed protein product [Rhizophagus irregularis]
MKLQSLYLPIAIFICACITFVSVTDAYIVAIFGDLTGGTNCRIWITDQNNNRIGGNGYHRCDAGVAKNITFSDTNNYGVHAQVQFSAKNPKTLGPFNGNTCFVIEGDVFNWSFTQGAC